MCNGCSLNICGLFTELKNSLDIVDMGLLAALRTFVLLGMNLHLTKCTHKDDIAIYRKGSTSKSVLYMCMKFNPPWLEL